MLMVGVSLLLRPCVLFLFWTDGHFQTFYSCITYPTQQVAATPLNRPCLQQMTNETQL